MFELFDRETGNLMGEFAALTPAIAAVREELQAEPRRDLSLGLVEGGRTSRVWAGDELDGLVALPLVRQLTGATAGTSAQGGYQGGDGGRRRLVAPLRFVAAASLLVGSISTVAIPAPLKAVTHVRSSTAEDRSDTWS